MQEIRGFRGDYRFLSNFWPSPIVHQGLTWPTAEHLYQAAKTLDPWEQRQVLVCESPGKAKRMGRFLDIREDWHGVKVSIMTEIQAMKYDQNPELRTKLLATGKALIVEENGWGDVFWGQCNGKGENTLGKILMDYQKKREEPMVYNEFQKAAAKAYAGGELEHHLDDAGSYNDCGDSLFTFIINELADDGDAMDQDTALSRIETAISDLNSVSFRLTQL